MGSGNEILDTYIYENNSMLEQLEAIMLDAESASTLSQDNINEIFRIMHTIKGSSAMMEFDTLATVAHRIEDMFFLIRENSMDIVSEANRLSLFDIMFQSVDYFRKEMSKIQAGQPLDKDIDTFLQNINSLIAKIKGEEVAENAPAAEEPEAADMPVAGNPDFPYVMTVFYDEGCGMESLRSFMLVTSVRDCCAESDFIFTPDDVETNTASSETVIERRKRLNGMGVNYLLNVGPDALGRIPSFSRRVIACLAPSRAIFLGSSHLTTDSNFLSSV